MKRIAVFFIVFSLLSMAIFQNAGSQDKYSVQEKEYLLNLARETIAWYLKYKQLPEPQAQILSDNLKENRPCFVTLMHKGRLRGCIGMFEFNSPLYKNVISRARAAAAEDDRFIPITYEELKDINIEISILTEPRDLKFSDPQDLLKKLIPLEDGVILYTLYGASTYLPQVWEQLPDKEDFLSSLCAKHGAPPNYWKDNYKNLRVEIYKAVHFEEDGSIKKKIVGPKGAVVGKNGAKIIGTVSLSQAGQEALTHNVKAGVKLDPGTIVTEDSDLIED